LSPAIHSRRCCSGDPEIGDREIVASAPPSEVGEGQLKGEGRAGNVFSLWGLGKGGLAQRISGNRNPEGRGAQT
jgi:hypothetical protein